MDPGELEEAPLALNVRAFFGLPVPALQRDELARFIASCAQVAPTFRWTPPDNLHLTVRFIGSIQKALVETVVDALAQRPLAAFDVELGHVGSFGEGRAARVVWLGLRTGVAAAAAMAAQVEEECVRIGLPNESRPYQAHLTLARARARGGSRMPELPALPQIKPWRARELILYSSRLTRAGAIYEAMRTLQLG